MGRFVLDPNSRSKDPIRQRLELTIRVGDMSIWDLHEMDLRMRRAEEQQGDVTLLYDFGDKSAEVADESESTEQATERCSAQTRS